MKCKICNKEMVIRNSNFGKFYACPSSYPENNHGTVSVKTKVVKSLRPRKVSVYEYQTEIKSLFDMKIKIGDMLYDTDFDYNK